MYISEIIGGQYNSAEEFLVIYLGIDNKDFKSMLLLKRAIEYADEKNYTESPKTAMEQGLKTIFLIKAASFFKRKNLRPYIDREEIMGILRDEVIEVNIEKSRLTDYSIRYR